MIKEGLEWLKDHLVSEPTEINGTWFAPAKQWKELQPNPLIDPRFRSETNEHLVLGTIESLVCFINDNPDRGVRHIIIRPSEVIAFFDEDASSSCVTNAEVQQTTLCVKVPLANYAKESSYDFDQFQRYLDTHRWDIVDYETVASAVRTLKHASLDSLTLNQVGPVCVVETQSRKGVESVAAQIPREISTVLPTGTREFRIATTFVLTIDIKNGAMRFTLLPQDSSATWETLVRRITVKLQEAGIEAPILEGV